MAKKMMISKKDAQRAIPVSDQSTPKRFTKSGKLKKAYKITTQTGSGRVPIETVRKASTPAPMETTYGGERKEKGATIYKTGRA